MEILALLSKTRHRRAQRNGEAYVRRQEIEAILLIRVACLEEPRGGKYWQRIYGGLEQWSAPEQ